MGLAVRPFRAEDGHAVASVFVATVRTVNAADYDPAQVTAWSAAGADPARWARTFAGRAAFVAEVDGAVAGFADVAIDAGGIAGGVAGATTGIFDHLYVSADHQGQGVGTALADAVEAAARAAGCDALVAEVSVTARPFFAARGYRVLQAQDKAAYGLVFRNYVMVRTLTSPERSP